MHSRQISTEILLLRGDDNLYIGLRFHDSDAARIARAQLVQGQAVISDDHLQLYLDPYDTGRPTARGTDRPCGVL